MIPKEANNNIVINKIKRDNTWMIQMPQCFYRELLIKMHKKYKIEKLTDECELFKKDNYKIIEGNYINIKITTCDELEISKHFLT